MLATDSVALHGHTVVGIHLDLWHYNPVRPHSEVNPY